MPLLVCVCLPVVVLSLQLLLLCESPSWLIMRGKTEQAKKTLKFMYPNRTQEERDVIYAEYEYTLGQEAEKKNMVCLEHKNRQYILAIANRCFTIDESIIFP